MTEVWIRIPKQDYLVADAEDYAAELAIMDEDDVLNGDEVDVEYAFDALISDLLTDIDYEIEVVEE